MGSDAVGVAPVNTVNYNAGRKTITFTNRSTAGQIIYLDNVRPEGLTTLNAGYILSPGAAISFLLDQDGPDIQGPWSAIADAAGGLLYSKETNIRR